MFEIEGARLLPADAQRNLDDFMVVARVYVATDLPAATICNIESSVQTAAACDLGEQGVRHRDLLQHIISYTTTSIKDGDTDEDWNGVLATLFGYIEHGLPMLYQGDSRISERKDLDAAGRGRVMQSSCDALMLSLISAPAFRAWSAHMRHGYSLLVQAYTLA